MAEEIKEWLSEVMQVFPNIKRKKITTDYKKIKSRKLGYVTAKIEQKLDFDPEALILGEQNKVKKRNLKPNEFRIFINQDLKRIKNPALRKEIVQNILIHELLHIESEDLITLSKDYSKRKKKKIHVKDFDDEVFNRYNKLRKLKGIMQISERKHLDVAISRILESINWYK